MAFNKGYELKKFEAHWEKLRIEYAAAGMAEDAIQKMYDYDRQQFNSERTRIERTQEFTAPAYESTEEEASPLMLRYQEAITTTDTYHETKRSFAWIPCPLWKVLASGQLARNGRQPDLHGRSPLRRCPLRIDARTPDHPAGGV